MGRAMQPRTASEPRLQPSLSNHVATPANRHFRLSDQTFGDAYRGRAGGRRAVGAGLRDALRGGTADRQLVPILGEIIPEKGQ